MFTNKKIVVDSDKKPKRWFPLILEFPVEFPFQSEVTFDIFPGNTYQIEVAGRPSVQFLCPVFHQIIGALSRKNKKII